MKDLFEILASLVKPLFNGIYQVLSGGFGRRIMVVAWLQVAWQFLLAKAHTSSALGTGSLMVALIVIQAFAALMSFMMVTGASFEPNSKKTQSFSSLMAGAAIFSAVFAFLFTGLAAWLLGLLTGVHGTLSLMLHGAAIAALQSLLLLRRLEELANKRK
jgi:hypothetical protein